MAGSFSFMVGYVGELRQALVHDTDTKQSILAAPVASRSAKMFYYLQQSLQKFDRGMELVRSTSMRQGQLLVGMSACGSCTIPSLLLPAWKPLQ